MVVEIILVVLVLQGMLAAAVYSDAYERGDDEGLWVTMTLLLGMFGVLLYLLNRPDKRIPEEERNQSASSIILKVIGIYVLSIIGGALVGTIVAIGFASTVETPQSQLVELAILLVFLIASPLTLYSVRNIEWVNNLLPDRRVG